jgi:hypothetical protein
MMQMVIVVSCKENEMDDYVNDPAIYFAHGSNYSLDGTLANTISQNDSINYSFFILDDSIKRDTIYVFICTQGEIVDYDRPISLIQTNEGESDAAVSGVHFVGLDDPAVKKSLVVPADQVYAKVPIIMLRDASLELEEKRLELSVAQNEYFRPGIDEYRNFIITTTDIAVKPSNWDTRWKWYFGPTFGSVKFRFIINATGYTEWEKVPMDFSYISWMMTVVQQKLYDYNLAHPDDPLKEADGTLVTFN